MPRSRRDEVGRVLCSNGFARMEQNYAPRPSRFTMVIVKRDGRWMIVHHHSSPRAESRQ
jgi:hypothetical protein